MAEEMKYLCKYQVSTLVFMMGDKRIEMDPSNIIMIEYLCDYESNLRSILKVKLRMDIRKKIWLLKNKRDIKCKFELCKIGMDTDLEEFVTNPETVWNEEFGIYFNDEEEELDITVLEDRLNLNDNDEADLNNIEAENYFESQNIQDVYLFNQKLISASMATYNDVFTKDTMQQFVGRVLTKTKHTNVLISKFENDEVYEELLVPALPAYKAIAYLDQYYGFFKKGSIIFYDVDCMYIINANGKCTAKRDNEWTETSFLVSRLDTSIPGHGMIKRENEKVSYISVPEGNVNPRKFSMLNNASVGSDAEVVIVDDTSINNNEADQSYIDKRNKNIVYQHKADNKYTGDMIKARMEEAEMVINISGENYDINAFTPNREFQVIFEEQLKQDKYGIYKYRLSYAYHCIKLESDGYMSSAHRIILKRRAT